ncbi:MAG: flagellar filament capping protein FliD [Chlamydiales bacterium]|nr:flagellar filament capping protein FliD [Chlamydiales bacterium]NCF70240.1 flagellar filament capping protein FliD [Chlamydiales bacterium]
MSDGSLRLGGLFSGLDTDTMIQTLLQADQIKIDSLQEEKELVNAKIDTWEDISQELKSFGTIAEKLRAIGTDGFTLFDDKITSSTTATVGTAIATSGAQKASYDLTVTNIAKGEVEYSSNPYTTVSGAATIDVNGTSIDLADGDDLDDIALAINSASYDSGLDVTASVIDSKLVITQNNTGTSATVALSDTSNTVIADLGMTQAQAPADASITLNGVPITSTTNVVSDVTEGLTLNLISAGSTTLTVNHDTATVKETLTDFIDAYNEFRDLIERVRNVKLDEDDEFGIFFSDSLLRSLFNEARTFSTSGVTFGDAVWDGANLQANASVNDTTISVAGLTNGGTVKAGDQFTFDGDRTIYTVEQAVDVDSDPETLIISPPIETAITSTTTILPAVKSLETIGIGVKTDTVTGLSGILDITDEAALDAALESDMASIKLLFARVSGDGDSERFKTGVGRRIYDWIDSHTQISVFLNKTRSIDDLKIPGFEDDIEDIDKLIARQEERMAAKEQALIRQFSSLEQASAQAQQAGSAISNISRGAG